MSSRSGFEDALSIGSTRSDNSPKHCVALYDYTVSGTCTCDCMYMYMYICEWYMYICDCMYMYM